MHAFHQFVRHLNPLPKMERITPNDLESFKGTDQAWDEKLAMYPSLKKLEEHPKDFTEVRCNIVNEVLLL